MAPALCAFAPSTVLPGARVRPALAPRAVPLTPAGAPRPGGPPRALRGARLCATSGAPGTARTPAAAPTPSAARAPGRPLVMPDEQRRLPGAGESALLPVAVVGATALALWRPGAVAWFGPGLMAPCLALIMLSMGLTLRPADFSRVARQPARLLLGAAAQYGVMPLLAYALARALRLPPALATGVVLVGACPGGAASNIVCLFAGADVAYSVLLTLTSTALSAALTPLLVLGLAGQWLPVRPGALLASVLQVVVLPLAVGGAVQASAPAAVRAVEPALPALSVALVAAIVASVVARSGRALGPAAPRLLLALALLHALGAAAGYLVGALARAREPARRTLAVEVCMQNSTLASGLAAAHFADPLVAAPGAVSATLHSVFGSCLAAAWRFVDARREHRRARAAPAASAGPAAPATEIISN